MNDSASPRLCVVTAAAIEFNAVAKLLQDTKRFVTAGLPICQGRYGRGQITLLQSAIGAPGFAGQLQEHLTTNHYDALLVIGLAGALAPELKTGEVVVYDHCLDARAVESELLKTFFSNRENSFLRDEFASIPCDATLGEQLVATIRQSGLHGERGAGALVERVITEARAKAALYQQTQAAAVDMETWLILTAVAEVPALPCGALRVISDEASCDLPDFNTGLTANGQMQLWPTLRALAARPRASGQFLLGLWRALRNLKRATAAVFTYLINR